MNKVAIAFSTCDKTEQVKRVVQLLLQPDKFDLFWSDGSKTAAGQDLPRKLANETARLFGNVGGGPDACIAFNLTAMLGNRNNYEFVGLVEDDVLLPPDWFERTMNLFELGRRDGLEVGAVSTRAYEDRILIQRDDYAIMHNLGAGQVIFTRRAAELILEHFRTGWTLTNRRVFNQLSGIDIGAFAFFKGGVHALGSDWHFDTVLAAHGLASLALTPSPIEMLGQDPPLDRQGLEIVRQPIEARRSDAFERFRINTEEVRGIDKGGRQRRQRRRVIPFSRFQTNEDGGQTIFPHQIAQLGGHYEGDWKLHWQQGWGPFVWEASVYNDAIGEYSPYASVPISGACAVFVSGGKTGGRARVEDEASGLDTTMYLPPEEGGRILSVSVPASVSYRQVRVTALSPGVRFYGVQTKEPQPWLPDVKFDHSVLPPTG